MHRRIKNAKERSRKSGITNSRPEWWRLSRSIELRVGCRCLQTLHNYVNQTKYIWFVWEITQRERGTGRNGRKGASFLCDLVLISTYIFVSRSVRLRFVSVVCTALHGFSAFLASPSSLSLCTLLRPWWFRCNMCNSLLYTVPLLYRMVRCDAWVYVAVCVCVDVVLLCSNASECAFMNEKLGVNCLLMRDVPTMCESRT